MDSFCDKFGREAVKYLHSREDAYDRGVSPPPVPEGLSIWCTPPATFIASVASAAPAAAATASAPAAASSCSPTTQQPQPTLARSESGGFQEVLSHYHDCCQRDCTMICVWQTNNELPHGSNVIWKRESASWPEFDVVVADSDCSRYLAHRSGNQSTLQSVAPLRQQRRRSTSPCQIAVPEIPRCSCFNCTAISVLLAAIVPGRCMNVLLCGLGGGSHLNALSEVASDKVHIKVVEIDSSVIEAYKQFFATAASLAQLDAGQVSIICGDYASIICGDYCSAPTGPFNVVFMDVWGACGDDKNSLVNISSQLAEDAVLVINTTKSKSGLLVCHDLFGATALLSDFEGYENELFVGATNNDVATHIASKFRRSQCPPAPAGAAAAAEPQQGSTTAPPTYTAPAAKRHRASPMNLATHRRNDSAHTAAPPVKTSTSTAARERER